ncbi:hypothetical protein [Acidovorax carolinensis]|nr:hypothetical protein [Acidovorax carolinensis]
MHRAFFLILAPLLPVFAQAASSTAATPMPEALKVWFDMQDCAEHLRGTIISAKADKSGSVSVKVRLPNRKEPFVSTVPDTTAIHFSPGNKFCALDG